MTSHLRTTDLTVLLVYMAGVFGLGCWFARKSANTKEFMAAGGALPGWAVGLSIFGTYLSSNTFLGVPGKRTEPTGTRLSFPRQFLSQRGWAVRYFVPFYRHGGEISVYHHFEHRFGPWARTYAVICYLLFEPPGD